MHTVAWLQLFPKNNLLAVFPSFHVERLNERRSVAEGEGKEAGHGHVEERSGVGREGQGRGQEKRRTRRAREAY